MSSPYDGHGEVPAPDQSGQFGYQPPPPFAPPGAPGYPPPGYGQPQGYPPAGYGQYHPQYPPHPYPYQYPPPGSQGTNGLAIASMILGILWIWWIGTVLALVFGYVARSQIKQRPGQGGDGMAIAGIVLGWVGVAGFVIFIIAVLSVDNTTYSLLSGV